MHSLTNESAHDLAAIPRPGGAQLKVHAEGPSLELTGGVLVWATIGPVLLSYRPLPATVDSVALAVADVTRRITAISHDMLAGATPRQALGYPWSGPYQRRSVVTEGGRT
ncbi:MAG: hypothetical protein M3070_07065 [Actinomycetota bacterium]|nr:hypothetical protein [Actinomycetota bacterium]